MNNIRLNAGQSFDIEGDSFTGRLHIELSDKLDFEVSVPHMESHRRGKNVAIRNPQDISEISVSPGYGHSYFPTGTKLFVTFDLQSVDDENVRIDFPTFEVGGLRSFPVAVLHPGDGRVRLIVAETTSDTMLDEYSAGVRSALRRSIERDSLPDGRRRDVVLLVDVTSSMHLNTSPRAFEAMCMFAAGVLSTSSGDRELRLASSSSATSVEVLSGPEAIRQLTLAGFPAKEVGWSRDLGELDEEHALVVLSDGLPADVADWRGVVHLLTTRKPVDSYGISYTIFDDTLIDAVMEQNAAALAVETRNMFDTLTQGEK